MFKSTWQKVFLAVIVSGMSSLLFTTVFIWYGVFGIYWFWYFVRYFCRAIKKEKNVTE